MKNRDKRIGACADIGHWQTSGIRAVDGLETLEGRLVSLHLKERAALGPNQHDTLAIEYEFNWYQSVPDIAQCIGFVRGWAAATPAR